VGGKRFGDISRGPQADGTAVEQGHPQTFPERGGALRRDLAALQAQGLSQKFLRQAAPGITVGAGGSGKQLAGELGIELVGAAAPGVGQDGLEGMVVVEPLKEQIPEGDQGSKQTLIEGERLEGRQVEEGAVGEELEEAAQQVGRAEARREGFGVRGVFFDGN